jgi:small-conductance mechanosensitive channel
VQGGSDQLLLPLLALVGLVGVLGLTAYWIPARRAVRELEIRERVALIEKGLSPPPELMPTGSVEGVHPPATRADRYRTAGILFVGLGLALMLLLGAAANIPQIGVGVGGAIALLGAALIAISVSGNRAAK